MKDFKEGFKDSIPIALGYLAVSFSLGIAMLAANIDVIASAIMSLTNVTSAGEFAAVKIIVAGGSILELILTEFIINIRYSLMSLSLSQKLSSKISLWQRLVIAFANTDEIFAVAMARHKSLTFSYMLGLQCFPIFTWVLGTILGNVAASLMPPSISVAMGVALYGMFIAIVIPEAKKSKSVLLVVIFAIAISCILYYVPLFSFITDGLGIVISTVVAAAIGAIFFPVEITDED